MESNIINQWDAHKRELNFFFETHLMSDYDDYEKIFRLVIKLILNGEGNSMNISDKITVIDDGDYQGTQLFICHEDVYQPEMNNYYITDNYYGSCSGCDTLLGILEYDEDKYPSEQQVKKFMQLALNMVQKMKCLGGE